MKWPWSRPEPPVRLEDYYESHPELRLFVKAVLSNQTKLAILTEQGREQQAHIDLLEGNPSSTTGGTLTSDIYRLTQRADDMGGRIELLEVEQRIREGVNGRSATTG